MIFQLRRNEDVIATSTILINGGGYLIILDNIKPHFIFLTQVNSRGAFAPKKLQRLNFTFCVEKKI